MMAESTGRVLATRLYELTDDLGMKDMLSFLITRDAMHQNQWLAVLEELGGPTVNLPIPNSFPDSLHLPEFDYAFVSTNLDQNAKTEGRWTTGESIDGKGTFKVMPATPAVPIPDLGIPDPKGYAQTQQMQSPRKRLVGKYRRYIITLNLILLRFNWPGIHKTRYYENHSSVVDYINYYTGSRRLLI